MRNKKAVSPLIATVLLVTFSVALGAIVMNFSHESTEGFKEQADDTIEQGLTCSLDISVNIVEAGGNPTTCYNRTGLENFETVLENEGTEDVKGVTVILIGQNGTIKTTSINDELGSHKSLRYSVDASEIVLPPSKAIIKPLIEDSKGNFVPCENKRIEIEDFRMCE